MTYRVVFALTIALSVAGLPLRALTPLAYAGTLALLAVGGVQAYRAYADFWERPPTHRMHDWELENGE